MLNKSTMKILKTGKKVKIIYLYDYYLLGYLIDIYYLNDLYDLYNRYLPIILEIKQQSNVIDFIYNLKW